MSMNAFTEFEEHLRRGEDGVLIVTGAGVSRASGMPLFRGEDPDAVWNTTLLEKATLRYFLKEPVDSWRGHMKRALSIREVHPNPAHDALVCLEAYLHAQGRECFMITQNVDELHHRAGQQHCVPVHGSLARVRCITEGCDFGAPKGSIPLSDPEVRSAFLAFQEQPVEERLPRCPACSAILRPHILWFDERYDGHLDYGFAEAMRAAKRAKTVLYIGTSFSVGITHRVLVTGLRKGAKFFSLDPSGRVPRDAIRPIVAYAEEALPALIKRLRD